MENNNILENNVYNSRLVKNTNCSANLHKLNVSQNKVNLHGLTKLNDDNCLLTERNDQSVNASDYMLSNFRSCDKNFSDVLTRSTDNQGIIIKDGYDVAGKGINESNKLRVGEYKSRPKPVQQLFERPYLTIPFMGRGSGDTPVETELITGDATFKNRFLSLAENQDKSLDLQYTPLVKNLKDNIQNPNNLVEEKVNPEWVRGGMPSRQIVKDLDYFARSKDDKSNKDYIMNKKAYMHYCL